jgi:hypothetical protein
VTAPFKIHAYEPYWLTWDTWDQVIAWINANNLGDANGAFDVTVLDKEIHYIGISDGKPHVAPLLAEPSNIPRPEIPHLAELQQTLASHRRAEAPLLVLGDCLAEEHSGLTPGGAICHDCSYTSERQPDRSDDVSLIPWPCKPARAAAEKSGVELW